ncbi:hypothetical protein HDV00_011627 [Rhizophlyctis rosea]|nr:hypothetical protein HDV00_011627 [Rhizophlyctis rosea]
MSTPTPRKPTLSPLTGARGLAAQIVALGHIIRYFMPTYAEVQSGRYPALLFSVNNLTAVSLFFVISGFTLVVVYDRDVKREAGGEVERGEGEGDDNGKGKAVGPLTSWPERKSFFIKRVARLAPVYYLALLFGIPSMIVYIPVWEFYFIPSTLLMLQSLTYYGNSWVGPLWSVSAFIPQYILFVFVLHPDIIAGGLLGWAWQYNFIMQFLLTPIQGFWVLCLSQIEPGKGPTSWILTTKAAKFLGDVSYAFYCLHWPVLQWTCWMVAGSFWGVPIYFFNGDGQYHFFTPSALPLLIITPLAVATVAHNVLEKPARQTIRKKADVPTPPTEAGGREESQQPELAQVVVSHDDVGGVKQRGVGEGERQVEG